MESVLFNGSLIRQQPVLESLQSFLGVSILSISSFTGYNASDFQFASSIAKRSLDFFQSYLIPSYPLSHLQLLLSPNFAAGAMENYGLLIFRGEYLQISESANTDQQRRVAYVVAHEIAHQWFGDAVTTSDWSDVFIQEGFATMYG